MEIAFCGDLERGLWGVSECPGAVLGEFHSGGAEDLGGCLAFGDRPREILGPF